MFFKKKDHEYLEKELSEQRRELNGVKLDIETLKTQLISLRNTLNKRIGSLDPATETSKSNDGLDSLRK